MLPPAPSTHSPFKSPKKGLLGRNKRNLTTTYYDENLIISDNVGLRALNFCAKSVGRWDREVGREGRSTKQKVFNLSSKITDYFRIKKLHFCFNQRF